MLFICIEKKGFQFQNITNLYSTYIFSPNAIDNHIRQI